MFSLHERECECRSQDIPISLSVSESAVHVIFTFIMIASYLASAGRHFIDVRKNLIQEEVLVSQKKHIQMSYKLKGKKQYEVS